MKKFIKNSAQQMRDWWRDRMHSTIEKMSRGAAEISRCITSPQKDQWRRNDKVQHSHRKRDK